MKTRVINLTAHEARAFQRGATMLVRECKPQPVYRSDVFDELKLTHNGWWWIRPDGTGIHSARTADECMQQLAESPYFYPYQPGDLLIGREAWMPLWDSGSGFYTCLPPTGRANDPDICKFRTDGGRPTNFDASWQPASRMPAELARVRRIVSAVSLKRCQELTEADIEAMKYDFCEHNARLWAENRFVWVTNLREET